MSKKTCKDCTRRNDYSVTHAVWSPSRKDHDRKLRVVDCQIHGKVVVNAAKRCKDYSQSVEVW